MGQDDLAVGPEFAPKRQVAVTGASRGQRAYPHAVARGEVDIRSVRPIVN